LTFDYFHIITPIMGLIINSSIQLLVVRYIKRLSYFKSVVIGFGAGIFFVLILEIIFISFGVKLINNSTALSIINIVTYSLLGLCYFSFINLSVTAIRVRLLSELYEFQEGLEIEEIMERYNSNEILIIRIDRLINNGQITYKNDRYYAKKSITLVMAIILELLRFIILGQKLRIHCSVLRADGE